MDLIWYDGGFKPPTPEEMEEDLPAEGMMFVGDKGKILAGFHVDRPRLVSATKQAAAPEAPERQGRRRIQDGGITPGVQQWIDACRGGKQADGCFLNAWPISEAVNLYAASLRSRQKLRYDAANMKITNSSEANKYLSREYRKGWEPDSV